jgi:hypothetical protein
MGLLNRGFGTSSVSMSNEPSGSGGSGFSKKRRPGYRYRIGGSGRYVAVSIVGACLSFQALEYSIVGFTREG